MKTISRFLNVLLDALVCFKGQRISTGMLAAHDSNVGDIMNKVAHLVLDVNNVTKEDEGNYTCKATDHTGKSETTTTYVKVHGNQQHE